jgi:hypothetical protein
MDSKKRERERETVAFAVEKDSSSSGILGILTERKEAFDYWSTIVVLLLFVPPSLHLLFQLDLNTAYLSLNINQTQKSIFISAKA